MTDPVRIYHNPRCSKSRATLALLQAAGVTPEVIDYLATPPDAATLADLAVALPGGAAQLLRDADAPEGLAGQGEAAILTAIAADPRLLNRPIVITPQGTRLTRPPETVLDLLSPGQAARARAALGR